MSWEGFEPVVIDRFGGLDTLHERGDVPRGSSPSCRDVDLPPGLVRTRQAFSLYDTVADGGINGLSAYTDLNNNRKLISLSANGGLWVESGTNGAKTLIDSKLGLSMFLKSATLFGRAYMALSDGNHGLVPPIQWDGSTYTVVGGTGCVVAPTLANSATAGSIAAGLHYIRIVFETASGALLPAQQGSGYVATGGFKLDISNVQVGSANVVRKHVYASEATPSGLQPIDLYRVYTFTDNATTLATIDFSESSLSAGESYNAIAGVISLPPQLGCATYGNQTVWWGGISSLFDYLGQDAPFNLRFDSSDTLKVGWTENVAGCSIVTNQAGAKNCLYVTGSGAITNQRENPDIFNRGVGYSYWVRARKTPGLVAGQVDVYFNGHTVLALTPSNLTTDFQIIRGPAETSGYIAPTDYLKVVASSALTASNGVLIDAIGVYRTDKPYENSLVWVSRVQNSESGGPEAIDNRYSIITPGIDDGYNITCCAEIRGTLYIYKEKGIYATENNGISEPVGWNVRKVDDVVGSMSVNGVALGNGFHVTVSEDGAYVFDGAQPRKLSTEIDPTWNGMNWTGAQASWAALDVRNKRLYTGLPLSQKAAATTVMVMDYTEGMESGVGNNGIGRKWIPATIKASAGVVVAPGTDQTHTYLGVTYDATNDCETNESYAFGPWVATTSTPAVAGSVADPDGGTAAATWTYAGAGTARYTSGQTLADGNYVTVAVKMRAASDTVFRLLAMRIGGPGTTSVSNTFTATSSWTWFVTTLGPVSGSGGNPAIQIEVDGACAFSLYHPNIQRSRFFTGDIRTTGSAVTATSSGSIAIRDDVATSDFFGIINGYYESAPLGAEVGRSLTGGAIVKARGVGSLLTTLVRPNGATVSLASRTLSTAPLHDFEIGAHVIDTQTGIALATNGKDDYFVCKTVALMQRRAPYSRYLVQQ